MVAQTVLCAIACAVLVDGERRHADAQRWAAKIVASCAFVGVAVLGAARGEYASWITIGLVLGLVGDVALLAKRGFLVGLVAFLAGHLAYVRAIAAVSSPADWPGAAGLLAVLPVGIGLAVLALLWRRLGTLRIAVIAYVAVIVAMVIGALAVCRTGALPGPRDHLLGLGAVLFFASDIAVARDRFVGPTFANRAWGLPAYYAAQLLIAWSTTR